MKLATSTTSLVAGARVMARLTSSAAGPDKPTCVKSSDARRSARAAFLSVDGEPE